LGKSVTTTVCPKCGGRLVDDYDDASCLMCGFVDYGDIPTAEELTQADHQLPDSPDVNPDIGPYRRAA